jgi:hypothetical protein
VLAWLNNQRFTTRIALAWKFRRCSFLALFRLIPPAKNTRDADREAAAICMKRGLSWRSWRVEYNERRPHTALAYRTPNEYAENRTNRFNRGCACACGWILSPDRSLSARSAGSIARFTTRWTNAGGIIDELCAEIFTKFGGGQRGLRQRIASGEVGTPVLAHCVRRNVDVPASATSETTVFSSTSHEIDVMPWVFGREM